MRSIEHHRIPDKYHLDHVYETEILKAYIYGRIVVVEAHEGVTISYKTAFSILLAGLRLIGSRKWVYISNRIHSYSLNPNDYKYLEKVPTLKGMAVVSPEHDKLKSALVERNFFKKPYETFTTLEDAFQWAEAFLPKK
ncbi:MAG: hypothetical protein CMC74_09110 [Flavobacteriaceae bacterium]|nr:hypothetical protein [Flavobacteriaceae bacterium]|tara:strand:+ start:10009 stop:10422 length:414 start_codon:yes stop_codon:yes gene_type:complete